MSSITAQLNTRAGMGSVTISHSSFPSGTIEVGSIGELSIEFDMRDTEDDADKIFFAPNKFTVEFFDKVSLTDGQESLANLLDSLTLSDTVSLTLDFTTDDGYSFNEDYEFSISDSTYKREGRLVEVESKRRLDNDLTVVQLFDNHTADVFGLENMDDSVSRDCMPAYEFIRHAMGESVGYQTFISHSEHFDSDYESGGDELVVIEEYTDDNDRVSENDASTVLFRLGALEGSIIGSIFGYNFYVHRLHTGDSVTINEDDTEELSINIGKQSYRSIFVFANRDEIITPVDQEWGMDAGSGSLIGDSDGLRTNASQGLKLYFYLLEATLATHTPNETEPYSAQWGYHILGANGVSIEWGANEGSDYIAVDGDPQLSKGDVITFANDKRGVRNYLVEDSGIGYINLATPLQQDIDQGTNVLYYDTGGASTASSVLEPVCQDGADAYANAYGADGENKIEVKIYDVDSFDPHQTFVTDSSFPDAVSNNEYRPSELTIDLINDIIETKAYQIA